MIILQEEITNKAKKGDEEAKELLRIEEMEESELLKSQKKNVEKRKSHKKNSTAKRTQPKDVSDSESDYEI